MPTNDHHLNVHNKSEAIEHKLRTAKDVSDQAETAIVAPSPIYVPITPRLEPPALDPRIRLKQAGEALELLQRIIGKITNDSTASFEENARLRSQLDCDQLFIANTDAFVAKDEASSTATDLRAYHLEKEVERMKMENMRLSSILEKERAQHRITAQNLERFRQEASTRATVTSPSENGGTGKNAGISKAVVTELALKLIEQGPTAANTVAGLLLDEVARVASIAEDKTRNWNWDAERNPEWTQSHQKGWKIQKDKRREEGLGPTQRLMTLEGVMDVTLGRVDGLEKDVRRIRGFTTE